MDSCERGEVFESSQRLQSGIEQDQAGSGRARIKATEPMPSRCRPVDQIAAPQSAGG